MAFSTWGTHRVITTDDIVSSMFALMSAIELSCAWCYWVWRNM